MSSAGVFAGAFQYRIYSLIAAAAGTAGLAIGYLSSPRDFFISYLIGFLAVVAVSLGSLGLIMIHNLTGGWWGWTARPFFLAGVRSLPVLAVLFIPIALGVEFIYPWTDAAYMNHDPVLSGKLPYLNVPFWTARAVGYWVFWILLSFLLRALLISSPDGNSNVKALHRVQKLSGIGLLLLALTVSFAAIDWVMTLEPHWFSSMFGVVMIVGDLMSAFGFSVLLLVCLDQKKPNIWMTQKNLHDLGKFIFMTVMLWAYIQLSQFLIIWGGNLPEETFWYHERSLGFWKVLSAVLVTFQFAVPFLLLLSKRMKRNPKILPWVICVLFAVRWLEQVWLVAPGIRFGAFPIHWLDIVAPLAIGGVWSFFYFTFLGGTPEIPVPAGGFGHGHSPASGPQDQVREAHAH